MVSRIRLLRSSSCALVLSLIALLPLAAGNDNNSAHVRNFGRVDANFYRGAEPSLVALKELRQMGVGLVIDLRETGIATSKERSEAEHLHMRYVNVPLPPWNAPTPEDVQRVLAMLESRGTTSVFVHCRRGKDRTGTIVACYRIEHDHWSNARAQTEANSYGMSNAERAMRRFVLHFAPMAAVP